MFLENPNSPYYLEIKENWNSNVVMDDKPFLSRAIKNNIQQSMNNGILMVFADYVSAHVQSENDRQSIYNQPHYPPFIRKEEGFELPLYYHICFIGLMYTTAINNRVDIGAFSSKNHNMQTIYSRLVIRMLNNMVVTNTHDEYPTNFHWLISKIFKWQSEWLNGVTVDDASAPNFVANNSYVKFIPNSIANTLAALYAGVEQQKITIEFLNSQIYYNVLSPYFDPAMNDNMKTSIENSIIQNIPNQLLQAVLHYSLDIRFALSFNDFINEDFNLLNEGEPELVLRLLNFLRTNNKIESGN